MKAEVTPEQILNLVDHTWPEWVNYIATDADGETWGYEYKPTKENDFFITHKGRKEKVEIVCKDWEKSLCAV